jgi:hypothetical protein
VGDSAPDIHRSPIGPPRFSTLQTHPSRLRAVHAVLGNSFLPRNLHLRQNEIYTSPQNRPLYPLRLPHRQPHHLPRMRHRRHRSRPLTTPSPSTIPMLPALESLRPVLFLRRFLRSSLSGSRMLSALLLGAFFTYLTALPQLFWRDDVVVRHFVSPKHTDGSYWKLSFVDLPMAEAVRAYYIPSGGNYSGQIASPPAWSAAAQTNPISINSTPVYSVVQVASGWPMKCFYSTHIEIFPRDFGLPDWETHWGIPLGSSTTPGSLPPRTIPLRPIPFGLIVSVLAWTLVAAIILHCAHLRRSAQRRRLQLCTHCAYPIANLTTCPECGTSVPTRGP